MPEQLLLRPENPAGRECRVSERQACELPTACRPAAAFNNKESSWGASIRDISVGGIRLVLRRRFESGTGLAIELPGADEAYTVLAKVVHVKPTEDGSWALGCKFISELSEHEVERLLSFIPCAQEEATELDAPPDEATELDGPPQVLRDSAAPIRDVRLRLALPQGAVIDCVIRRFKAAETWPLEPGKLIAIRGGAAHQRWTLNVRVRRCVHREGSWTLDCELANAPSAKQLLAALAAIS